MSKQNKSRKDTSDKVILATAILSLIKVIFELLKELLE